MINVCITGALARAVGTIAKNDPDRSVQIEWRETSPQEEWFVTTSDGVVDTVYVVDDETGTHAPLTAEEMRRYLDGETIMGDPREQARRVEEPRFQVHEFDRAGEQSEYVVVDHWQVGSDGERLIVGTYPSPELAGAVRDALAVVAGPPGTIWPPSSIWRAPQASSAGASSAGASASSSSPAPGIVFAFSAGGDFLTSVEVTHRYGVREVYGRGERIPDLVTADVRAAAEIHNVFLDEREDGLFVPSGPVDDDEEAF